MADAEHRICPICKQEFIVKIWKMRTGILAGFWTCNKSFCSRKCTLRFNKLLKDSSFHGNQHVKSGGKE